jgi:hypothetical protein
LAWQGFKPFLLFLQQNRKYKIVYILAHLDTAMGLNGKSGLFPETAGTNSRRRPNLRAHWCKRHFWAVISFTFSAVYSRVSLVSSSRNRAVMCCLHRHSGEFVPNDEERKYT